VWLGQGGWYVRRGLGWAGEWEVAGLSLHSSVLALPIHQWGNHPVSRGISPAAARIAVTDERKVVVRRRSCVS
jgi:hypothetical protein